MKAVIDIPMTKEEIDHELEKAIEEFRKQGLLPIESEINPQEREE